MTAIQNTKGIGGQTSYVSQSAGSSAVTSSSAAANPVTENAVNPAAAVQGQNVNPDQEAENVSINSEETRDAIKKALEADGGTKAVFGFHEDPHRVMIKFVDKETNKVIREIPSEKFLDYISKVWEQAGLLVDEKR